MLSSRLCDINFVYYFLIPIKVVVLLIFICCYQHVLVNKIFIKPHLSRAVVIGL